MKVLLFSLVMSLWVAGSCFAGAGTYADRVTALSFNKEGSTLAVLDTTSDNENIVLLLDARSGKVQQKKHLKNVSTLLFDNEDRLVLVETKKSMVTFRDFATNKVLKSTKVPARREIVASSRDMTLLILDRDLNDTGAIVDTQTGKAHKLKPHEIAGIAYGKYAAVYDGKGINLYNAAKKLLETHTKIPADIDNLCLDIQGSVYLTSQKPKMITKVYRNSNGVPFEQVVPEVEVDDNVYISIYDERSDEVYRVKHVKMTVHSMAAGSEFIAVGGLGDVTLYKRSTGEVGYQLSVYGGDVEREVLSQ